MSFGKLKYTIDITHVNKLIVIVDKLNSIENYCSTPIEVSIENRMIQHKLTWKDRLFGSCLIHVQGDKQTIDMSEHLDVATIKNSAIELLKAIQETPETGYHEGQAI